MISKSAGKAARSSTLGVKLQAERSAARKRILALSIAAAAAIVASRRGLANSSTWVNTGSTDGNWSTPSNWDSFAGVPGSTSSTANTDVATFNSAVGSFGTAGSPVVIDSATQNIGGISFDNSAGNYVIGSTSLNTLRLTSGGTIQILNSLSSTNAVETINSKLSIQAANGTYSFVNNSANGAVAGAGTLNFGGAISGAVAGATVLKLDGSNTNANTVSGVISNGTATTLAVTKSGLGTWVLSGANTYTGGTTVSAGTLRVDLTSRTGTINPLGTYTIGAGGTLNLLNTNTATDTTLIQNTAFSGAGTITKTGAGYLTLHTGSSVANFTGTIDIQGGTLSFNNMGTGASSGRMAVNVGSGATLDDRFNSVLTLDKLTGTGTVTVSNTASTLSIGNNDGSSSFGGVIQNGVGLALVKNGSGTQTLTKNNTYTGSTTINGGSLTLAFGTVASNILAPASQVNLGGGA